MRAKYLIILLFFFACNRADKYKKINKSSFYQIIQGEWLNYDFISKVKETKSPNKSYNDDLLYSALSIDTTNCSNDTLRIGCSLNNNHEAFEFNALFNYNDTLKTDISNYERKGDVFNLILTLNGVDTSLFLNEYSDSNQLIKSIQYKKIKSQTYKNGVGGCINEFVMDCLFAGRYKLLTEKDSDLNKQVLFSKNGNVSDLYGKRFYDVQVDFRGSYKNLDQIFFMDTLDDYSNCIRKFYKLHDDTIMIYKTKKAIETGWDSIAYLDYKLIKIK